jgi:hypothetical protein
MIWRPAMNRPGWSAPDTQPAIERYLAQVTARLPGSPRARSDIVAELRSGLLDATEAHCSAGRPPADALGLALLGVELATAAGHLSPGPAAAAATASIARLTFARRAARRCLAIRAGLT